ncbi:meiotic recombination protein REC8 homolog [Pempheris klunzingeri]|uniref:meiotic recombination protein REC8 homolog n=1 Tax=Pempheris klunzingeri TaxID=3127111 RepID=UPI00397EAB7B
MFYYPTVLKRHTGCFSTIWLVATKAIRIPRRDFLKVNVKSTCDDIMNYVLERVPPPRPDLPQPRFSLYLSSQLQYGVVVVYHRQCVILLEELQSVVGQLVKQKTSQKIDMDDHGRQSLDFPDALSLLEETEGAPDPLFGLMYMQDAMPSPSTLIQMGHEDLRETSPEQELTSPPAAPDPSVSPGITASPDSITLKETEPVAMPVTEVELLQPTTLSSEDAVLLPQEEPSQSVEEPRLPADQLTPVSLPPLPSPPSAPERPAPPDLEEDVPPAEMRTGRRRQLIFFDPETQLSQEELQQQITNPLAETRRPVLPQPPSHRMLPAAELLKNPCTFLPEELQFLWRRAATVTAVSGSDLQVGERGPESTDSEKERERETVEVAEREEERLELSPQEVARDLAESEVFDISGHGTLPLEGSDQREVSREISPMYTSEREGSPVSRSVSTLQDIPEVVDEPLERAPEESPGLLPELAEHQEAPVLFQSLLPPEVNRRTVSNIFQRLLESLSARKVCAEQDEPYGDILISIGPNYEEVLLTL